MSMLKITSIFSLVLFFSFYPSANGEAAKSNLKKCPKSQSARYHNCFGKRSFGNTGIYVGEFKNNNLHGDGTFEFSNGNKHFGAYEDGVRNGIGTFAFKSGEKYSGNFVDDNYNGHGTTVFPDGNMHVGMYKDNKRNGYGTFTFTSGEKYIGEFRDGKYNGLGTTFFPSGSKYVGGFKDGKRSGRGTYTFKDGEKYVGEFKNDKYNGTGTNTRPNGYKYVGQFKDDQRNGYGTGIFSNGEKYIGEYKEDRRNGIGTYFSANGSIKEEGIFKNDKLVTPKAVEQQLAKVEPKEEEVAVPIVQDNQRKVALVIGNAAYEKAPSLKNPRNDAIAISSMLSSMGFTVVNGTDLKRRAMELKIREFIKEARQADVSLLFYAGHGIQVAGQNYLVPVDAGVSDASAVDFELINVRSISTHMGGLNTVGIVLLDACRDNPFTRSLTRSLGTRSSMVGTGLAPISSDGGGLLVGFATAPGDVAADGRGANSPFTTGLLKHLPTPGLEIELALKRVKATVVGMTKNDQRPWHNSDLAREVYLVKR